MLRHDRELLLLPVLSFVATLVVIATFLVPLWSTVDTSGTSGDGLGTAQYVVLAVLYVVLSTVTVYFQTALVSAADDRLSGGDPTIRSALAGANRHLPQVIAWGALTGTVSLVLRVLEERLELVGRIVVSLVGIAWSLATFLVVPTYVVDDVGPIEAVKRSGSLLRRTWGENVAAQVGFGLLGFVASLVVVPIVMLGAAAGTVGLVVAITVAAVWIGAVAVVTSALTAVFQTALYHFASRGPVPGTAFSPQQLSGAFAPRGGRGGSWIG